MTLSIRGIPCLLAVTLFVRNCVFRCLFVAAQERQKEFNMAAAHLFVTPVICTVSRFFASTRPGGRSAERAAGRPAERLAGR